MTTPKKPKTSPKRTAKRPAGRPISDGGGRAAPLVLRLRPGLVALLRAIVTIGHAQTDLAARGIERELATIVRRLCAAERAALRVVADRELARVLELVHKRSASRTAEHDDEARRELGRLLRD